MEQRAQALLKGREETARLIQQEKDKKILELRARLAEEESKNQHLEQTKKRAKSKQKDKKEPKKVRFSEELSIIPPSGVVVDFKPVEEVAPEEMMQEDVDPKSLYTSTDGWEDWSDNESNEEEPNMVLTKTGKMVPRSLVEEKRQQQLTTLGTQFSQGKWKEGRKGYQLSPNTQGQPQGKKYVQITRNAAGGTETHHVDKLYKSSHSGQRLPKRLKQATEPLGEDESASPGYFDQVMGSVKYHGSKLVSRGAAQLTVFALGGILLAAKGGLERLAQKHSESIPQQYQAYLSVPPPAQSFPSTPSTPQTHNYPVQQGGYQSLDTSPFGPKWK